MFIGKAKSFLPIRKIGAKIDWPITDGTVALTVSKLLIRVLPVYDIPFTSSVPYSNAAIGEAPRRPTENSKVAELDTSIALTTSVWS